MKQVSKVIIENKLSEQIVNKKGKISVYTSGQPSHMNFVLSKLFKNYIEIQKINWTNDLKINL